MQAAVAAILDGMPDPLDLHVLEHDGQVWVMAGSRVLACYQARDTAMRNMTVVVLTGLGFSGKDVAAALGLTAVYVSMLRSRARAEGSAGLARRRGVAGRAGRGRAAAGRAWRAEGDGGRGDRSSSWGCTAPRSPGAWARGGPRQEPARPAGGPGEAEPLFPEAQAQAEPGPDAEPEPADGGGRVQVSLRAAGPQIAEGGFYSRYAGAMLLHAFASHARRRRGAGRCRRAAAASQTAGGGLRWRCCRSPACASPWARPPPSSSST